MFFNFKNWNGIFEVMKFLNFFYKFLCKSKGFHVIVLLVIYVDLSRVWTSVCWSLPLGYFYNMEGSKSSSSLNLTLSKNLKMKELIEAINEYIKLRTENIAFVIKKFLQVLFVVVWRKMYNITFRLIVLQLIYLFLIQNPLLGHNFMYLYTNYFLR